MAPPWSTVGVTLALSLLLPFPAISSCQKPPPPCFESIISFGDSIADTGNLIRLEGSNVVPPACSRLPYGETFFHHPTGRFSDGRLVIDFIAESLGLPLVQPYVGGENFGGSGKGFEKGVNFAVGGATALDCEYLKQKGIGLRTNASLGIQMTWFKQFLGSLQDSKRFVQNSLILLGEIGGNDYNFPFQSGMSREKVQSLAPAVVKYIGLTLQELINLGAKTIVVPGNFPIGCVPVYLTLFKSDDEAYYDPRTGCIKWLNEFATYHNELLNKELNRIRELHPGISIIYADYYNPVLKLYLSPGEYGFGKEVLKACCGGEGLYNGNASVACGSPLAKTCENPSLYVSWDGLHLTEAAYKFVAKDLIERHFATNIGSSPFQVAGYYPY